MRLLFIGLVALVGCNSDSLAVGQDKLDGGSPDFAGSFCGSTSARIELNGTRSDTPVVQGTQIILNCCSAGRFEWVTAKIATPIFVEWRQAGLMAYPATVDLANLPSRWNVTVYAGCVGGEPGCTPSDTYASGLTGTLSLTGTSSEPKMSVCLGARDASSGAHPAVHALDVWSPPITPE